MAWGWSWGEGRKLVAEASRWDWVLAEMLVRLWGLRLLQGVPVKENSRLGTGHALWSDGNAKLGTGELKKCLEGEHTWEKRQEKHHLGHSSAGSEAQRWGRGSCRVTREHGAGRSTEQAGAPHRRRARGHRGSEGASDGDAALPVSWLCAGLGHSSYVCFVP